MKIRIFLYCLFLVLLFNACGDEVIEFKNKEVFIKGTTNKVTIQVPTRCGGFNSGISKSIQLLGKYAKSDPGLKASYDKVVLIDEFSSRIESITTAQCVIVQNSTTIDPNISDQAFYNELVKSYVEYQKIKDFAANTELTPPQKMLVDSAINSVYKSIFVHKNQELIELVNDLNLTFNALPGTPVQVYVNGKLASSTVADASGNATCVVPKRFLIPEPNKTIFIKIVNSALGYESKQLNYTLGETLLLKKSAHKIKFE